MLSTVISALVFHATIRGTINPATQDYLHSSLQRAERENAKALIVELDTPGGLLTSVHQMAQLIDESKVPVVIFVTPAGSTATSAGALLSLSSHLSAMTPGTNIGAAHPVDQGGKDIEGAMGSKVLNDTVKFAESMAQLRGRNVRIASEMVSKSRSLTAQEAFDEKIVEVLANDPRDLLQKLNGRKVNLKSGEVILELKDARLEEIEMSFGQKLLHFISNPNLAALLTTLGMLLLYMELKSPGIQVAGILGVLCLILSFMAFQTLPIRTGGLGLMALGLGSLIAEVFASTHGALALGGVVSFILGMIWVIDPSQTSSGVSPAVWIPSGVFLGGGTALIGYFARRVSQQAKEALAKIGGGENLGLKGYRGVVETVVQSSAEAASEKFSEGKMVIRGETWSFRANEQVHIGEEVEVVSVHGFLVTVKKV
jgi:membrane-bound serine protease (ClpP class)